MPFGFVGSTVDAGLFAPASFDIDRETSLMVEAGIESVRIPIQWSHAQPYASWHDVPAEDRSRYVDVAGVPTIFELPDRLIAAAATGRLRVLPVITTAPGWAAKKPGAHGSPPADARDYAVFMEAVVRRYGPGGSFWAGTPDLQRLSIRSWQVWNEPNLKVHWDDSTWAPGYVALLRAARAAIRRADPGARIVLAGLPNRSFRDIAQIYRRRGARKLFDVAAVHSYTSHPSGVVKLLKLVRTTMRRYKDSRKPLMMTEFGWPSSRGKTTGLHGFETHRARPGEQAARPHPAAVEVAPAPAPTGCLPPHLGGDRVPRRVHVQFLGPAPRRPLRSVALQARPAGVPKRGPEGRELQS